MLFFANATAQYTFPLLCCRNASVTSTAKQFIGQVFIDPQSNTGNTFSFSIGAISSTTNTFMIDNTGVITATISPQFTSAIIFTVTVTSGGFINSATVTVLPGKAVVVAERSIA